MVTKLSTLVEANKHLLREALVPRSTKLYYYPGFDSVQPEVVGPEIAELTTGLCSIVRCLSHHLKIIDLLCMRF